MGVRGVSAMALVAISVVVAGCGGGGSDSPSKAEFIKQADAVCKKIDQGQLAAMARVPISGNRNSKANQEKVILAVLPRVQREAEEIAELGAPSGDEGEVATIVKGIEEGVSKAEENPVDGLEEAFVPVEKRAAAYGLKACSEPL